ncbi:MAG TPA: acetate/propionate family kinase [Solirubrobacteraceae bacterium]|nr:acetate/propionate family kinase [Solirubrobacteraceae bacterium]
MRLICVNAGSSSLKLSLIGDDDATLRRAELPAPGARVEPDALTAALQDFGPADGVVHRIVHGGRRYHRALRADATVISDLDQLCDLAPLHQPKSLAALRAVSAVLPGLPAIACFDTAFHHTIAPAAATYALPARWRDELDLHRYGFHGLSHGWVAGRTAQTLGPAARRVVSCHLGAGASLCAIRDGRSVDTTMGFTPLAGLVMATRSGDVDPGLLLWLLEHERMTEGEVAAALEHGSGLLGLCGTADMAEVLGRSDPAATLALEVYLHRLRAAIAAMTAALGGLDALVFTGGVGERSAQVRAGAAAGLGFLGVELDPPANAAEGEREITAPGAGVRTLVVAAREDLEMARQARGVLGGRRDGHRE